jgi:CheY-like chemotaxis protein
LIAKKIRLACENSSYKVRRRVEKLKMLRVLVVEDDALLGFFLSEILVAMGHEVCVIAASEADAIIAAARFRPDFMIVDARLREGSGVSAVEQILQTRFIPHVFMSGAEVKELRPDAVILYKPFREADLAQAIRRVQLETAALPTVSAARDGRLWLEELSRIGRSRLARGAPGKDGRQE